MDAAAPLPTSALVLLGTLALASLALWMRWIAKFASGAPILPQEPKRPVAWGGAEVALLIVLMILLPSLAVVLVGLELPENFAAAPPRTLAELLALKGAAMLVAIGVGAALFVRQGASRPEDLGLSLDPATWLRDARLAVLAFLTALLPVYTLQIVLVQWFPEQHAVLEMLRKQPDPLLIISALFTVVIVAPVAEEFIFRLALQGWLEKRFGTITSEMPLASEAAASDVYEAEVVDAEVATPESSPVDSLNPYDSPRQESSVANPPVAELRGSGVMPVVISSVVFASLHFGQGPAPISLLPLALILGYLYLRTGRLLPCVLTHALFNGLNLLMLWLSLQAGK